MSMNVHGESNYKGFPFSAYSQAPVACYKGRAACVSDLCCFLSHAVEWLLV